MKEAHAAIRSEDDYERIIQSDGTRTTVCTNRFEVIAQPTGEVNEQQVVQRLREWIKGRREKGLQDAGGVSE